jgi:hypothetical protein
VGGNAVSGCTPTAGLGLAGHQDPRLQRLYFLVFSDGSCSGGFDFLIFFFFFFYGSCFGSFFFFGFSHSSGDF